MCTDEMPNIGHPQLQSLDCTDSRNNFQHKPAAVTMFTYRNLLIVQAAEITLNIYQQQSQFLFTFLYLTAG